MKGRSYLRYDSEIFQNKFNNLDWSSFDDSIDEPNKLWELFEKNITQVLDELCPIRLLTVPESKPKWLNNEILLLIRKRDKMYKEARRKNNLITWRKAHFLRNRVEMLIKQRKKEKIQEDLLRKKKILGNFGKI